MELPQTTRSMLALRAMMVAVLAAAVPVASNQAMAQQVVQVPPDLRHIAAEVEKARNIQEIQNLMARRMYFHSVGHNEDELALWSQRQEIRWAQNQGCWVGMKSLRMYYDTVNREMQAADLARISKANPAVRDDPSSRGVGNNAIHTLTTPLIVIADDGQSAKASWYTPGVILSTPDGRTPAGSWIWERYATDIVREDGQWRFLHVQVNTDFMNPMGSALQPQGDDAAATGSEKGAAPKIGPSVPAGLKIPGPDIVQATYRPFGASRVPSLTPRPPEPYRTLADTFQYADCGH